MPNRQSTVTLKFLAEPSDVNLYGNVHGGSVMKWIDQAGYAAAVGWSGRYCVTVAVGGIQFVQPILIGDLVTVRAKLIYTGSSSMHFAVDVLACDLKDRNERLATSCVIVFVALDSPDGKPTAVAPWAPQTPEDKRLAEYAERMMGLSKAMERQVAEFKGQPAPP